MNAGIGPEARAAMHASALTPRSIAAARRDALAQQRPLLEVLAQALEVDLHRLAELVGAAMNMDVVDLAESGALQPAFDLLPYREATQRGCLSLRGVDDWFVVVSDPFDEALRAWCHARLGLVPAWTGGLPAADGLEDLSIRSIGEGTSVVVRLVQSTLYDALKSGASDVHFESQLGGLVIKYRLDGMLVQVGAPDGRALAEQVLSRLKVMAELDIAERRIPQDGRFRLRALGREVDFRVSIMPSIHGEDAVVRVLDKQSMVDPSAGLRLDILGFEETTLASFRRLSRDPYGLLLVTGPTGSGKTTTLYTGLLSLNSVARKVVTVEDPIEYQLPGVNQIQVKPQIGLNFATLLRSILRQDPDVIMVGEIRDLETAQIAVQAALTGHLVLSTVHTNSAAATIARLRDMGLEDYLLAAVLRGILAQRRRSSRGSGWTRGPCGGRCGFGMQSGARSAGAQDTGDGSRSRSSCSRIPRSNG